MKKSLLASVVVGLALVGCGGGGSSNDSSSQNPKNPESPNSNITPTEKLENAANLEKENNGTWYQFELNGESGADLFTHSNYNNPTEFTFKNGKILSSSSITPMIYPTYFTDTGSYLYDGSDTIDNVNGVQRIGKIKNKEIITEKGTNGQDVVYLSITSVPYTANQYDNKELTITHKYKVVNLDGKAIAETLAPFESDYVNSPTFRSEALSDSSIRQVVKMVDKQGSFAATKFKEGAYCLSLVSSNANQDYFFSKTIGSLPSPTFENMKDTYSEKQDFNVQGGNTGTLFTVPSEKTYQLDSLGSAVVLENNNSNQMTARYYQGNFFKKGEYNYQEGVNSLSDVVEKYYIENFFKNEGKLPADFKEYEELLKQHSVSGCHLFNREGRNQARNFLINVNK